MAARHQWTTADLRLLREADTVAKRKQLASALGVSYATLNRNARRLGIDNPVTDGRPTPQAAEDIAQALELRSAGFTWAQVATLKQTTADTIRSACRRALVSGFDKYPKREVAL